VQPKIHRRVSNPQIVSAMQQAILNFVLVISALLLCAGIGGALYVVAP
jgi:hypothetical protein